jgi:hypothetical protein
MKRKTGGIGMVKAVLRGGVIYPTGPLPSDWRDGQELRVEEAGPQGPADPEAIDRWYAKLESLCAAGDPEDDERLDKALAEAHEQAKAFVRRRMGLPG